MSTDILNATTIREIIIGNINIDNSIITTGIEYKIQTRFIVRCIDFFLNFDRPLLMENSVLHAKKLGLPEIILPNDVRNDLYVNIVHGELKKGKF